MKSTFKKRRSLTSQWHDLETCPCSFLLSLLLTRHPGSDTPPPSAPTLLIRGVALFSFLATGLATSILGRSCVVSAATQTCVESLLFFLSIV